MKILALLVSLSLLVFIHELGHYIFARLFKTRVEKFYLFFNPYFSILRAKKIDGKWKFSFFSRKSPAVFEEHKENTEWGIGWLPFGGYCAISGMIDENTTSASSLPSEVQPWEYRAKPAWQRLLIILGGVMMNFIGALIIFSMMLFYWGKETLPVKNATMGYDYTEVALKNGFQNGDIILAVNNLPVTDMQDVVEGLLLDQSSSATIQRGKETLKINLPDDFANQMIASNAKQFAIPRFPFVIENFALGSLAEKNGMQIGDSIVAINNIPTPTFTDFVKEIANFKNKEITITFYRKGHLDKASFALDDAGKIGAVSKSPYLMYKTEKTNYGFFESIPAGIAQGTESLVNYVKQFKFVFSKEGASQLGGFGSIGNLFPSTWNWAIFWNMTAFLSIILAFMNILPIPGLDGGHFIFVLWEMITGKKPGDKFLERAQMVGMVLLFALLIYANGNDLVKWIGGKF
ncbi:MAG: RIP metalloprotease RseP [Bacteroidales bacterium]|jgi:regulator of sigma E protease|nr:RIP metalloprotease RseP [Bacteroidales bacterium]